MEWTPEIPVRSSFKKRINVNTYGEDFELNIATGDITGNMVSGLNAFKQQFGVVMLTENNELFDFGLNHLIPFSNDLDQFRSQARDLAEAIVSNQTSDSTYEKPDGLGYSVEAIHSISKVTIDDTPSLIFKMELTGVDYLIEINVPIR